MRRSSDKIISSVFAHTHSFFLLLYHFFREEEQENSTNQTICCFLFTDLGYI